MKSLKDSLQNTISEAVKDSLFVGTHINPTLFSSYVDKIKKQDMLISTYLKALKSKEQDYGLQYRTLVYLTELVGYQTALYITIEKEIFRLEELIK